MSIINSIVLIYAFYSYFGKDFDYLQMGREYTLLGLIGAMAFFSLLLLSDSLQIFFSRKAFRQLGSISFGIYILHYPLLGLVTCPFIYTFLGKISYGKLIMVSFLLTALAVLASSLVFHQLVEQPLYRLINSLTGFPFKCSKSKPSIDK